MSTPSSKPDTELRKPTQVARPAANPKATLSRVLEDLLLDAIDRDPHNRLIDEDDEPFLRLIDSIRLFGVLQRLHVRTHGDRYQLIDGERRWRAARRAGLTTLPCEIWPATALRADILSAGIVLNEQRAAHSILHLARRLRDLKNTEGLTVEEVAARVSVSIDRAKNYLSLFGASDDLLQFFDTHDVPLRIAVEIVRYEKATNEARSRALIKRYLAEPLTREQVVQLRKRDVATKEPAPNQPDSGTPTAAKRAFVRALERAYLADPSGVVTELAQSLRQLGYQLVPVEESSPKVVG